MKKVFTLLTLLVAIVTGAWADSSVESSGNTGSNNTAVSGTSYTLDGAFVAGKGGVQQGNMPDKGVKLRSNQTNLVFEVNDGYKITKFEFWGCGNTTTAVTIETATVDGGSDILGGSVELPAKGASTSGDIVLNGIEAEDNITLNFAEGSSAQIVGTWKVTYEQTEVIVKEITAVSLNGSDISDDDLATLKSTKALTIDGSTLNGSGALNVTLNTGATTVSKTNDGDDVEYTFSVDEDDYTVTVTDVAKTYSAEGSIVYYKKGDTEATGVNTNTVTANGITFSMVDTGKTFQYGTGAATISGDAYTPLKLSTGSGVNVTFPDGKVATKVIIYGWSASGNGAINSIGETSESTGDKSIDTSADIFYATNTSTDIYPSVYEYDLNGWESFYFNPGGSSSQPFVVMDFVLADEVISLNASGFATYSCANNFTVTGATAYKMALTTTAGEVTGMTGTELSGIIPAGEGVLLKGEPSANVAIAFTAEAATADMDGNNLHGTTPAAGDAPTPDYDANKYFVLSGDTFVPYTTDTTFKAGKAFFSVDKDTNVANELTINFGDVTAVQNVVAAPQANEAQVGKKAFVNGQLVIITENGYVNALGQTVK